MKNNLKIFVLSGFAAVIFILYTSIETIGTILTNIIEIEAEDANMLIDPIKVIKMNGASNSRGIVSATSFGIFEGKASYEIETKESGDYYFWGRCYWEDPCSNSFMISIDKQPSHSFGQNPILGKWHWVNLNSKLNITKGRHNLIIGSLEARSKMDKFILTTDKYYAPTDNEYEYKLFIDFQDGIPPFFDIGKENNLATIFNNEDNKSLLLKNDGFNNSTINLKNTDKKNYIFRMVAKSLKDQPMDNHFRVYFNYVDKNNYNCLDIINNQVRLSEVVLGQKIEDLLLVENVNSLINDKWVTISLSKSNEKTIFKIAGKTIHSFTNKVAKNGTIGISVIKGEILIDNIAYYTNNIPFFKTNFHEKYFDFTSEIPECATTYLEKTKVGKLNWFIIKGDWNGVGIDNEDVIEAIQGKLKNENEAMTITGDEYWSDYTFGSAVRPTDNKGIGLCFYVQDSSNYYMFKWKRNKVNWVIQLLKIENGNVNIINEKEWKGYMNNNWYKLEVKLNEKFIYASIDDVVAFKDSLDYAFPYGKVGLWTSSIKGVYYDDIYIKPTSKNISTNPNKFVYSFRPNQKLALDYCDWIPSNIEIIKHEKVTGSNSLPYIDKQFLDEPYLVHKKNIDNSFMISLSNEEKVPKDVNINFRFNNSFRGRISDLYRVVIEKNKAILIRNDKVISTSKEFTDRGKIKISHINNLWKIENEDTSLIEYKSQNLFDSTKIVFGFGGIGKARIPINSLIIEEIAE